MIKYSIIICTYNRYDHLLETIKSIICVLGDRIDYELLIIDNNSTDHTPSINEKYNDNSHFRYVLESNQGLSHARNRGIKEAVGDILVFLDDDIELESNYFGRCDELYADMDVSIVGGKVLPFEIEIPSWLPEKFYYLASVFDLGDEFKSVHKLMGANYTMKRSIALNIGDYNINLGRKGNILSGGEEVDYLNRARDLGYAISYDPKLIVYHKINNKLNKEYILTYSFEHGKSEVIVDKNANKLKYVLKVFKAFIIICLTFLRGNSSSDTQNGMSLMITENYFRGYLSSGLYRS